MNRIAALGAKIEAQLTAKDARLKAPSASNAHRAANPAVPFVLRGAASQFPKEPAGGAKINFAPNSTPAVTAEHGVGATFRRKGVLSDVPMPVTRVGEGVVFTTFTDTSGSHEMAFDPKQIDVVTKAPAVKALAEIEYFPALTELGKIVTPPSIPAALVGSPPGTAGAAIPASAAVAAPPKALDVPVPAGAIRLPDGTLQFAYTPAGGVVNRPPSVQAPVTADFGVGATFRIKGVLFGLPMTVTRVGNGVVFAAPTFANADGRSEMAFIPNQLDLVTPAPTA